MKITKTIAAAVVGSALITGIGATSALAAGTPAPSGGGSAPAANNFDCSKAGEVKSKLEAAKTKLPQEVRSRIVELQSWKQTAADAGLTKLAARIDKRIERLQARPDKITARINKLEARIDKKCGAAQ